MKTIDINLDKFAEEFITEMLKKTQGIPDKKTLLRLLSKNYKFNARESKEVADKLITIKNAFQYLQKRLVSKKGKIIPGSIKIDDLKNFPYSQDELKVAVKILTNLRKNQEGNIYALPLIKTSKNKRREKSK